MRRLFPIFGVLLITSAPGAASTGWTTTEVTALKGLWIGSLGPVMADPSNRVADSKAAALLGRALFSDARLSRNGRVSCATCHRPDRGFTDARPTGRGMAVGTRRTMPIAQALVSPWLFWDGRADSLWAQALGPIENSREQGFPRTEVARVISTQYRVFYEALFGVLTELSDHRRFPLRASPNGTARDRAAWSTMRPSDRQIVDRIFANSGKAIAAYERTLALPTTRFDRFVVGLIGGGPAAPLSASEDAGLRVFLGKGRCTLCHSGPMFSNQGFANTGVPPRRGFPSDLGRLAGATQARTDPFNCRGAFSDAGDKGCEELDFLVTGDPRLTRAYKVSSLRGVGQRAPYMHAGQFATLERVVAHYDRAPPAVRGTSELKPLHLTAGERRNLIAFLRTLDAPEISRSRP